jgi:hypothetical protein
VAGCRGVIAVSDEALPSFTKLVLGRALLHTYQVFKSKILDAIYVLVSCLVGAPLFIWLWGMPDAMKETIGLIGFAFAPLGVFTAIVFVWQLWLAPAALAYEAASARAETESAPANQQRGRLPAKPPINWQPWRFRTKYSLYEFAKILSKSDPASQSLSTEGSSYLRLLVEEANRGKIVVPPEYDTGWDGIRFTKEISGENEIEKADAIQWAEAKQFPIDHIK